MAEAQAQAAPHTQYHACIRTTYFPHTHSRLGGPGVDRDGAENLGIDKTRKKGSSAAICSEHQSWQNWNTIVCGCCLGAATLILAVLAASKQRSLLNNRNIRANPATLNPAFPTHLAEAYAQICEKIYRSLVHLLSPKVKVRLFRCVVSRLSFHDAILSSEKELNSSNVADTRGPLLSTSHLSGSRLLTPSGSSTRSGVAGYADLGVDTVVPSTAHAATALPEPDFVREVNTAGGGCEINMRMLWKPKMGSRFFVGSYLRKWEAGLEVVKKILKAPNDAESESMKAMPLTTLPDCLDEFRKEDMISGRRTVIDATIDSPIGELTGGAVVTAGETAAQRGRPDRFDDAMGAAAGTEEADTQFPEWDEGLVYDLCVVIDRCGGLECGHSVEPRETSALHSPPSLAIRIPIELQRPIFESVRENQYSEEGPWSHTLSDLVACSLVCRQWEPAASAVLREHVRIFRVSESHGS
ncbi:hypothetical protein BDK51DRAFT_44720 [Blyttiomyces helicus]|uniref:F-box domain-containing protein n=1 Tax=Blyttiomyces helicus TaxID=388810 RepID=A0A4V1ISG9_9FUNG|nr:hypothetical protein BDK51DRAFT_44720 [Blyttiomyces helicus]|eukprot:RKO93517.1 hypothetical protein BDK51DRAFT_44720 [Blyttiomyces helicus]